MVVSLQDYALLSVDAYNDFDDRQPPSGWNRLDITIAQADLNFSAAVYQKGSEIVIAYRGTDTDSELVDDILSAGIPEHQILDAYNLYQAVLADPDFAGASISFTGHSLGGGLAAVMSAHTGLKAHTFAPAPYTAAANAILNGHVWLDPLDETSTTVIGSIPASTHTINPFGDILTDYIDGEILKLRNYGDSLLNPHSL